MRVQKRWRPNQATCFCLALALVGVSISSVRAAPRKLTMIASIDLSRAFNTRSPWRFTAKQGSPVLDPVGIPTGDTVPGDILVCISKDDTLHCDASLQAKLRLPEPNDVFSSPHYLEAAQIVHPRGDSGRALFLVRMASIMSGDGDQLVRTQVLAWRRTSDSFVRVYDFTTGHNNNQEVRYIQSGQLKGDIISVEPAENAPYGFWVTVNALLPDYTYRQVLHYRSATTYGDGNPLAVIDSEMPNIEQRLGLWRPGSPLRLPASPCPRPHLTRMELWCR